MPYYDYVCRTCGHKFSEKRSFAEASRAAACPACASKETQKSLNAVAVIGNSQSSRHSIPLAVSNGGGCGCGGGGCACHN
jgi:putative FmdB family regulatory protein